MLENTEGAIKMYNLEKLGIKMYNLEKLATYGTQDEEKQNKTENTEGAIKNGGLCLINLV